MDLLFLKPKDFDLLDRAAQQSITELHAKTQIGQDVNFDGTPTPCSPIDRRFKWGQNVAVKPPARDGVKTVLKDVDGVGCVEGGDPYPVSEVEALFGYHFQLVDLIQDVFESVL